MLEHIVAEYGPRRRRLDCGIAIRFQQVCGNIDPLTFLKIRVNDGNATRHKGREQIGLNVGFFLRSEGQGLTANVEYWAQLFNGIIPQSAFDPFRLDFLHRPSLPCC